MVPSEVPVVHWMSALSTNLTSGRIKTPSLEVRRTVPYVIPHVHNANRFPANFRVCKPATPIALVPTEEISFYAETAANVRAYGLVCLGPTTLPAVPAGDYRIVRCTGTTTLVANEWTSVKLTPDVALEAGDYALVGLNAISANAIAARAIITGVTYRPGVPALAGTEREVLNHSPDYLREVQLYDMGRFTHITLPEIQFLSSAADTSQVVYLHLIKV